MLSHISWQQYFVFILVAISLYYLAVWIFVLKMKLPSFIFLQNKKPDTEQGNAEVNSTVLHVIDELAPVFMPGITRPELLLVLQLKLKKYSQWEEPGFRDSLNQYIAQSSLTKCSIHLSEEDQRVLWTG